MKIVIMPAKQETIASPHDLLRTIVLTQDFWRKSEKQVEQALDIFTALDGDPARVAFTAECRDALLQSMVMEGRTLTPHDVLREYLRLQRAIQKAEDE